MKPPMVFQTHTFNCHPRPSVPTIQDCAINRAWSTYSQSRNWQGYSREQREEIRAAFYAGAALATVKKETV